MLVSFNQVPMKMAKKTHIIYWVYIQYISIWFLRIYILFSRSLEGQRVNVWQSWRKIVAEGRPAWPRSASGMSPPAIKGGIWFILRGLEKSGTWGPLDHWTNLGGWSETETMYQILADHPNRESWESWRSIWRCRLGVFCLPNIEFQKELMDVDWERVDMSHLWTVQELRTGRVLHKAHQSMLWCREVCGSLPGIAEVCIAGGVSFAMLSMFQADSRMLKSL